MMLAWYILGFAVAVGLIGWSLVSAIRIVRNG